MVLAYRDGEKKHYFTQGEVHSPDSLVFPSLAPPLPPLPTLAPLTPTPPTHQLPLHCEDHVASLLSTLPPPCDDNVLTVTLLRGEVNAAATLTADLQDTDNTSTKEPTFINCLVRTIAVNII